MQSRYPNGRRREKSGCREQDPLFNEGKGEGSWGERCHNTPHDRADKYRKSKALVFYFHAVKAVKHLPGDPFSRRYFKTYFARGVGHQLSSLKLSREGSIIASRSADRCRCAEIDAQSLLSDPDSAWCGRRLCNCTERR